MEEVMEIRVEQGSGCSGAHTHGPWCLVASTTDPEYKAVVEVFNALADARWRGFIQDNAASDALEARCKIAFQAAIDAAGLKYRQGKFWRE